MQEAGHNSSSLCTKKGNYQRADFYPAKKNQKRKEIVGKKKCRNLREKAHSDKGQAKDGPPGPDFWEVEG